MKRGTDASMNSLFEYAAQSIEDGLYLPIINLSYAGNTEDLHQFESYAHLLKTAEENNVKVLIGVMGLAAGVIFGPGAITLGIAPKNQTAIPS